LCITSRWKTLAASAGSVVLLGLLSTAAFGSRIWPAFFRSLEFTRVVVLENGAPGWQKVETVFGMARMLGFGVAAAYVFHFCVAVLAISVAALVWRRTAVVELQAAALVLATMLVTPHLLHYDIVLLALPIAWIAADGLKSRFLPGDFPILALLWIYPVVMLDLAWQRIPLTPIIIAAGLFLCARRGLYPAGSLYRTNAPLETRYGIADMPS
jgi:alpha-1,2-mannosyltransferase